MREIQQGHELKKMLYSTVTIAILSMLILILLRATVSLYEKRNEIVAERNVKEEELRIENEKLRKAQEKKDFLETERGKEEYIRTTFPVAKEGEKVIIVYDDKKSGVSPVKKERTTSEKFKDFTRDLFGGAE
jgi:regulator of replication initiation timing